MKKFFFAKLSIAATIGIFVLYVLIATFEKASGEALDITQKFKSGDVISADMFNELFATISRVISTPTMPDLVGSWQCTKYIVSTSLYVGQHYATLDAAGEWSGLQVSITFTDNGDGTYTWDSGSTYNAFEYGASTKDTCAGNGKISSFNGKFAITVTTCTNSQNPTAWQVTRGYEVKKLSPTKIEMNRMSNDGNIPMLLCDKQDIPPSAPSNLSVTATGGTVSLSWTDNSSTETGFKVLRKDSLTGSYAEIAVTSANTTTYQDTVTNSGTYWYWIKATNTYGDSDGSNVMSVDFIN